MSQKTETLPQKFKPTPLPITKAYRMVFKQRPSVPVFIIGPPGIGKTVLARHFAMEEARKEGRIFVDISEVYIKYGEAKFKEIIEDIMNHPEKYYVFVTVPLGEIETAVELTGFPVKMAVNVKRKVSKKKALKKALSDLEKGEYKIANGIVGLALIAVVLYTGCTLLEALSLRRKDIDPENKRINIRVGNEYKTKTIEDEVFWMVVTKFLEQIGEVDSNAKLFNLAPDEAMKIKDEFESKYLYRTRKVHLAKAAPPAALAILTCDGIKGVLFLDDATKAMRHDALATLSRILKYRMIPGVETRKIAPGVRIICTGNLPEHTSQAIALPEDFVGAYIAIPVVADTVESWIEHMNRTYGDAWDKKYTLAYLKVYGETDLNNYEFVDEDYRTGAVARAWDKLALLLYDLRDEVEELIRRAQNGDMRAKDELMTIVWSAVGYLAPKFVGFLLAKVPSIKEILENPEILNGYKDRMEAMLRLAIDISDYIEHAVERNDTEKLREGILAFGYVRSVNKDVGLFIYQTLSTTAKLTVYAELNDMVEEMKHRKDPRLPVVQGLLEMIDKRYEEKRKIGEI